jgi:hypothetical protein
MMDLTPTRHRDRRSLAALGLVTAALAATLIVGLFLPFGFFTDVVRATSAGLLGFAALALVGAWRGSAELRVASAIACVAWVAGPLVWALRATMTRPWLFGDAHPVWWWLALLAAAVVMALVTIVGLARGRRRSWMVALAGGWAGVTFFGVLLAWLLAAATFGSYLVPLDTLWALGVPVLASALVLAALTGRRMSEHFAPAAGPAPQRRGHAWRPAVLAGATLNAVIASILALDSLLFWQGLHGQLLALVAAAFLGASALLTFRGRTAGLLLAIPGAAAAALLEPLVLSDVVGLLSPAVLLFTFAPALLAALLGLAPTARPMVRFMRLRDPQGRERPLS